MPCRYVLLPNKLPPKRFEAHLEVHAGSVDERPNEQAGPQTICRPQEAMDAGQGQTWLSFCAERTPGYGMWLRAGDRTPSHTCSLF